VGVPEELFTAFVNALDDAGLHVIEIVHGNGFQFRVSQSAPSDHAVRKFPGRDDTYVPMFLREQAG
jgi:hypothetical protein